MKRGTVLIPVIGLALLAGLSLHAENAGGAGHQKPPMFPKITLLSLQGGDPVPITSYRGHPVLINFWATWCPPCRAELPELQHLYEKYGQRGLKVAAVNVDRSSAGVTAFVRNHNLTLPVFRLDESALRRLRVSSIPMSVLIDGSGRVVKVYRGYGPTMAHDLEKRLDEMLADRAGNGSS